MARKKKELNRADELLDELITEYPHPENILGEGGLLRQLGQRLIERALVGELTHHLNAEADSRADSSPEGLAPRNSRNR